MSMKNSNDTIGNHTRDLPTGSAEPQFTHIQKIQNDYIKISFLNMTPLS